MEFWYGGALALSAIALFAMAITRFGVSSPVDRWLCGVGSVLVGWPAFHLLFLYEGEPYRAFYFAFVLPVYASYRLFRGFRNRKADRAERATSAAAVAAGDEWRSTRRW